MNRTAEQQPGVVSSPLRPARHDYDLLCEPMQRQRTLRCCDYYITSFDFSGELQASWDDIKHQAEKNLKQLQELWSGSAETAYLPGAI